MDENARQATRLWTLALPKVSAFVASVVRDFKDRDDVLQDIAVAVLDSFESYDQERSFDAWALGVARNQVGTYLNRHKRHRSVFGQTTIQQLELAFAEMPKKEAQAMGHLQECVGLLDAKSPPTLSIAIRRRPQTCGNCRAPSNDRHGNSKSPTTNAGPTSQVYQRKNRCGEDLMDDSFRDLIHGYFDGELSDQELAQLEAWIQANPENARQFAADALLHDR